MPSITYVRYEGSDAQILDLLSKLIPNPGTVPIPITTTTPSTGPDSSSAWDVIAKKFERCVSAATANGRPGQKNAMVAWLRAGGNIELTKLWKAAGVKNQHDYSGVGSSLTKNLQKAGGPGDWYQWRRENSGEWIYTILPELVEPLKRAFGVA